MNLIGPISVDGSAKCVIYTWRTAYKLDGDATLRTLQSSSAWNHFTTCPVGVSRVGTVFFGVPCYVATIPLTFVTDIEGDEPAYMDIYVNGSLVAALTQPLKAGGSLKGYTIDLTTISGTDGPCGNEIKVVGSFANVNGSGTSNYMYCLVGTVTNRA